MDDGGIMIDEMTELRAQLEREQSLRAELEEQVKDYATRLGETFVDSKPKEESQTTIQYHPNTNTVCNILNYFFKSSLIQYIIHLYIFSVWWVKKLVWRLLK